MCEQPPEWPVSCLDDEQCDDKKLINRVLSYEQQPKPTRIKPLSNRNCQVLSSRSVTCPHSHGCQDTHQPTILSAFRKEIDPSRLQSPREWLQSLLLAARECFPVTARPLHRAATAPEFLGEASQLTPPENRYARADVRARNGGRDRRVPPTPVVIGLISPAVVHEPVLPEPLDHLARQQWHLT